MTDDLQPIREALAQNEHHSAEALAPDCPGCEASYRIQQNGPDWLRTLLARVDTHEAELEQAVRFGYHWQRDGMGYGGMDEAEALAAWRERRAAERKGER